MLNALFIKVLKAVFVGSVYDPLTVNDVVKDVMN